MKINFPMIFEEWPDSLPHDQDRAEVRLLSLIVTAGFFYSMVRPIFYMLTVDSAPLNTVSALTDRRIVILLFLFFAISTLPQAFVLIFREDLLQKRLPRKMLVFAGIFSGVLWGYLAVLALPLDYGLLPVFYALNAACGLIVGGVFGFSLNCQQLRAMVRLKDHEPPAARV